MPANTIGELVLRPILEFFFEVVAYYIGRVVVSIISLGRLKCDRITADVPRHKLKWGGSFHRRGKRVHLTAEATAGVGVLFVVLVILGGVLIAYWRA